MYIYIQRLCSIFSIITRFLRDKFLMIDIGYVGLVFVFLPLNKRTIWSFQMVCMQIHYVCTSLSLCLEVQISARTVPESLKFHSSKIPGLLSCWQLQEQNAKRCEKQQLTHCRLLAAGVSKDADFRPLDTDANPPSTPPTIPAALLRAYLPPASIKCI